MTAAILPFPLARRLDMIERQSRYAAELNADAAERFIQRQLKIQRDNMRQRSNSSRTALYGTRNTSTTWLVGHWRC